MASASFFNIARALGGSAFVWGKADFRLAGSFERPKYLTKLELSIGTMFLNNTLSSGDPP